MFRWFYRAAGLGLALAIVISEYRKTGDLIAEIVWFCFFVATFELLYWLNELRSLGPTETNERIKAFFSRRPH